MSTALTPGVSLVTGGPAVSPWFEVTADVLGAETNGSSGDLSGTVSTVSGRLQVAGTPPATLANGGGEMTRQAIATPWTVEDGDLVEVRWTNVSVSAASSWQLGVMLSGTNPGTNGTLQVGIYGATSRGGNIGSDNASTEFTESPTLGAHTGQMGTCASAVGSVMAISKTTADALVDANARRSVSYSVDTYALYIVHGTVNTSQDAGTVGGKCEVRLIKRGA